MYNFGVVMTDEEKKLLSTFEARLRHLIYLHDELKRENAELKQLLEAKEEEYGKVQAEYRELELNYTNLKTATTISLNGSDVKETKLRLSKLVREVDKCIALLVPQCPVGEAAEKFLSCLLGFIIGQDAGGDRSCYQYERSYNSH